MFSSFTPSRQAAENQPFYYNRKIDGVNIEKRRPQRLLPQRSQRAQRGARRAATKDEGRRMKDERSAGNSFVAPASRRPVIEVHFFCLAGETPALQTRS